MINSSEAIREIAVALSGNGFTVSQLQGEGQLSVASQNGELANEPTVELPAPLLDEYLTNLAESFMDSTDPLLEALWLTRMNIVEELTTDHGGGRNFVSSLGLRRRADRQVEFYVEKNPPNVGRAGPEVTSFEWRADPGDSRGPER